MHVCVHAQVDIHVHVYVYVFVCEHAYVNFDSVFMNCLCMLRSMFTCMISSIPMSMCMPACRFMFMSTLFGVNAYVYGRFYDSLWNFYVNF